MVSLKLQKRLAASVLKCGVRKIWADPVRAGGQEGLRKLTRQRAWASPLEAHGSSQATRSRRCNV